MTQRAQAVTRWIGGRAPLALVYLAAPALMTTHSLTTPTFPWAGWGVVVGFIGVAMRAAPSTFGFEFVSVLARLTRDKGRGRHRSG